MAELQRVINRCDKLLNECRKNLIFSPVVSLYQSGLSDLDRGSVDDIYRSIYYYRELYENNKLFSDFKLFIHPYYMSDVYIIKLVFDLYSSKLYTFDGYNIIHPEIEDILAKLATFHSKIHWSSYDEVYIAVQITPSILFGRSFIHSDFRRNIPLLDNDYVLTDISDNTVFFDDYQFIQEYEVYKDYLIDRDRLSSNDVLRKYDTKQILSFDSCWANTNTFLRKSEDVPFGIDLLFENNNIDVKFLYYVLFIKNNIILENSFERNQLEDYEAATFNKEPFFVLNIDDISEFDKSVKIATNFFKSVTTQKLETQGILIRPNIVPNPVVSSGFRIRSDSYLKLTHGFDYMQKIKSFFHLRYKKKLDEMNEMAKGLKMIDQNKNPDIEFLYYMRTYLSGVTDLGNYYLI